MNRKVAERNSKGVRRCNRVDRISKLYDDLIVRVLSFLPLKEAAATSLVAPRWSQLWRHTPNLVFHNDSELDPEINIPITMPPGETCSAMRRCLKNIAWVNSVIDSHKALSLKQFAVEFYLHDVQPFPKWLHFALSRRVEILKFNFEDPPHDIDISAFSSIRSIGCKFVKELTLEDFSVSGEAIELFVHNSPLLERLVLKVDLKSDLVIVGGTFKYFELFKRGRNGVSIKVSAPNLTHFKCSFDSSLLFLEDVPNLVDASFELIDGDTLDCLANSTSNLEILTIWLHKPKAFSTPQMPKLCKLFLDYYSANKRFLVPVTDLLQASPRLQEFRLKVTDHGWHYHYFGSESIFEVPELRKSLHHHLKVFEFSGFYFVAADHMELLRYIVDNCFALEEVIISPLLEARYSEFPCESSTEHPKNNTYKILPSSYETYGNIVGSDKIVVCSDKERENELHIKKLTGQMVAAKVPHHINLLIGHFVSRLYIC